MYPPFRASWQKATRPYNTFPPPPLKFRTSGFPTVRLQTGIQPRPSSTSRGLSTRPACTYVTRIYTWPKSRLPSTVVLTGLPFVGSCEPIGSVSGNLDEPVQRPLAHQWVMLSRRVNAYYGLIRNSRLLPATYEFVDGSLPYGLVWAGTERLPNLLCVAVLPCRLPYPGGPDGCIWLFLRRL